MTQADPKPLLCVACEGLLGDTVGELPVFADGEHGHEAWCPQCFVHTRCPLEPGRWHRPVAVACARCRMKSVSFGRPMCSQCGKFGQPIVLPAKQV